MGATLKDAYLATIDLVTRAEGRLQEAARGRRVYGAPAVAALDAETRRRVAREVAPVLRGMLGRDRRVVLRFDDAPDVLELVGAPEAARLTQVGPSTPDHTIYSKRLPCFVPLVDPASPAAVIEATRAAVDGLRARLHGLLRGASPGRAHAAGHGGAGATALPALRLTDPYPRVVLLPGLGMFTSGKDARTAGIVADIYHHTAWVLRAASALAPYASLSAQDAFNVEFWPLELYKLQMAPPEKELARRVALVTGGASGIGRAVARRLAKEEPAWW